MVQGWADIEAGKFRATPFRLIKRRRRWGRRLRDRVSRVHARCRGRPGRRHGGAGHAEEDVGGGRALPFNLALVYLGLGDNVRALDNLEQARAADSQMMPWIGRDAMFDPLRAEPRFEALMKKLNFVE